MIATAITDIQSLPWTTLKPLSPFQTEWYLQLFSTQFNLPAYLIALQDEKGPVAYLPLVRNGDECTVLGMSPVLGGQTVTDYAEIIPATDIAGRETLLRDAIVSFLRDAGVKRLTLDFVREDSVLYRGFHLHPGAGVSEEEVAPYIALPRTWDEYLAGLDRVERKELKRKMKRLATVPYHFEVLPAAPDAVFDEFIRLHRLSDAGKEKFMTPAMEAFFRGMVSAEKKGWTAHFAVLKIDSRYAAIILFFDNGASSLLYNSGFDPEMKYYSSGLMAHALLIQHNIGAGRNTHDFLRGSERYKYDLGGKNMNLYKISINLTDPVVK